LFKKHVVIEAMKICKPCLIAQKVYLDDNRVFLSEANTFVKNDSLIHLEIILGDSTHLAKY
jgi:hypothetical protein